ncbi:MAG: hypothetical protein LBC64_11495 [Fibromonadaceae bacterium]|jgi:hypothetical protein|nr:hypothetical protein [Fibromonadaceae bacterium]
MKKVLSLAFIATVLLLGCSADGFYDGGVTWGKMCKYASGSNFACDEVRSKTECDGKSGTLVMRSECP